MSAVTSGGFETLYVDYGLPLDSSGDLFEIESVAGHGLVVVGSLFGHRGRLDDQFRLTLTADEMVCWGR